MSDGSCGNYRAMRPSVVSLRTDKVTTATPPRKQASLNSQGCLSSRDNTLIASLKVDETMLRDINQVFKDDMKKLASIEAKNKRFLDKRSNCENTDQCLINLDIEAIYGEEFQPIPRADDKFNDNKRSLESPTKISDANLTGDKERRHGFANLWLHPLVRVMSNRSFLNSRHHGGERLLCYHCPYILIHFVTLIIISKLCITGAIGFQSINVNVRLIMKRLLYQIMKSFFIRFSRSAFPSPVFGWWLWAAFAGGARGNSLQEPPGLP